MFDIWNSRSALAEEVYKGENYRISYSDIKNNYPPVCVIYCSSNNIWFPNEEKYFKYSFVENDYYEWQKQRVENADKEIWLRDIYKSWYVTGINYEINTIDKLIDFLKKETQGYNVILIGSSSGGYLAALLSKPLKAMKTIVFSAQFDLNIQGALNKNPFLQKYQGTERENYYKLNKYLADSNEEIYYIYPNRNIQDIAHRNSIKTLSNVIKMGLRSRRHGMVVYKCCIPLIINMSNSDLKYLFHKYDNSFPFLLAVRMTGIKATIKELVSMIWKSIKMKCF